MVKLRQNYSVAETSEDKKLNKSFGWTHDLGMLYL